MTRNTLIEEIVQEWDIFLRCNSSSLSTESERAAILNRVRDTAVKVSDASMDSVEVEKYILKSKELLQFLKRQFSSLLHSEREKGCGNLHHEIAQKSFAEGRAEERERIVKMIDEMPTNYRSDAQDCVLDFRDTLRDKLTNNV